MEKWKEFCKGRRIARKPPSSVKLKGRLRHHEDVILGLSDRYYIHELLGGGAAGEVYSATDKVTGRKVAVKWMYVGSDAKFAKWKQNEITILLKLRDSSPKCKRYFPTIYEWHCAIGKDGEHALVVAMEYIEGVDLQNFEGISLANFSYILYEVLWGLWCLHSLGIAHGDFGPHNIMITDDNKVKILDFEGSKIGGNNSDDILTLGVIILSMLEQLSEFDPDGFGVINDIYLDLVQELQGLSLHDIMDKVYDIHHMITSLLLLARKYERNVLQIFECVKLTSKTTQETITDVIEIVTAN